MRRLGGVILTVSTVLLMMACGEDPLAERESEVARAYDDSVAQSDEDYSLIQNYLGQARFAGLDVQTLEDGLHYAVIDEGNGDRLPRTNDIVSIDYIGRWLGDSIFDTSLENVAIDTDSAKYVENGIDVGAVMAALDLDLEGALAEINASNDGLIYPVFSQLRNFAPVSYNHIEGREVRTGSIIGFDEGLEMIVPQMREGGTGIILLPSAIAYGTVGSPTGKIAPNTVVIFEFQMNRIRP